MALFGARAAAHVGAVVGWGVGFAGPVVGLEGDGWDVAVCVSGPWKFLLHVSFCEQTNEGA